MRPQCTIQGSSIPRPHPNRELWEKLGFEDGSLDCFRDSELSQIRCARIDPGIGSIPARWWQWPLVLVGVCALALQAAAHTSNLFLPAFSLLATDFYTGAIHYTLDHFSPRAFIIGGLVSTFHRHHADPSFVYRVSFVTSASELLVAALLPLMVMGLLAIGPGTKSSMVAIRTALAWKTICLLWCEFSHRMAHVPAKRRPGWVTALQECSIALLLPPAVHARHHFKPLAKGSANNFCQVGLANPFLNGLLACGLRCRWFWLLLTLTLTAFDFVLIAHLESVSVGSQY